MDESIKFCKKILGKVSRSFALTIPMLDDDIYLPVLITYLQDRLLDNFEDELTEDDISLAERREMMDNVVKLFNPEVEKTEVIVNKLIEYAPLMPEKPLQKLTAEAGILRKAYDQLDSETKKISFKWLKEMNKGMQKYLTRSVDTFEDLNEYCYYVAGTVGGFLTDTIILKENIDRENSAQLKENFNDAGLFLQKVNLIRDIKKDIKNREKNYWPLKSFEIKETELMDKTNKDKAMSILTEMLYDVKGHIGALLDYYQALPDSLPGYRKFYCVNNALGIATIDKMEDNPGIFYGRKKVKVAKLDFMKILKDPETAFTKKAESFLSRQI
ncbi:MAG: squalene/phytoene synthase family protein [Halothermotrichaceae bacterium]